MGVLIFVGVIMVGTFLVISIHNAWNLALLAFAAAFGLVSFFNLPSSSNTTKNVAERLHTPFTSSPSSIPDKSKSFSSDTAYRSPRPQSTPFDYDHLADNLFSPTVAPTRPQPLTDSLSPPPSTASRLNSSDGRTYWIPPRYLTELNEKQRKVESARVELDQLERQVTTLGEQILAARPKLDLSNRQAVAQFNSKADRFRTMRSRYERDLKSFNASVDAYNARLKAVGTSNP